MQNNKLFTCTNNKLCVQVKTGNRLFHVLFFERQLCASADLELIERTLSAVLLDSPMKVLKLLTSKGNPLIYCMTNS